MPVIQARPSSELPHGSDVWLPIVRTKVGADKSVTRDKDLQRVPHRRA